MSATESPASAPDFDPEDYEGLQPRQTTIHPAELRKLRKDAKEVEGLRAQLAASSRRETFARAGIPLDHPMADYLVNGYQGELTPEAIRAEAVRLGMITSTPTSPEEIAAHQAAQAAAAGGVPPSQAPDGAALLAEMGRKQFAPSDDVARANHIREIARLAQQNEWRVPLQ